MSRIQSLQAAVYAALSGDATLSGMVEGVFDVVPEATDYPFIVIGESESRDASTSSGEAEVIDLFIRVYSDGAGKKTVQDVMARVSTLLHDAALTLSGGYDLANLRFASSAVQTARDGLSHNGLMRFRAVVEG